MKIKDTTEIQILSVDAVMLEFGYKREVGKYSYKFMYPVNTGEQTVSFNTAKFLHNTEWMYDDFTRLYYPLMHFKREGHDFLIAKPNTDSLFSLTPYQYQKVQSRKIVECVKLVVVKKRKLITQEHMVKLCAEFYWEQFIGEES